MSELWRRLLCFFHRDRLDRDLEEEMQFHLDEKASEQGEYAARRQFGNMTLLREQAREAWSWGWLDALAGDLRYAGRGLRRNPGFTAVAVLTLALGIGANTAIFSFLDAMLLRDLPVKDPEQLVEFVRVSGGARMSGFEYPAFEVFQNANESFIDIVGISDREMAMRAGGAPDRVLGAFVCGRYFPSLGVSAEYGRPILESDDQPGNPNAVAVLSYGFWQRRFGGDPAVIGMTIRLNETPVEIVGVMPDGFVGLNRMARPDISVPMALAPQLREFLMVRVFGRVKPGIEPAKARAEVGGPFRRFINANRGQIARWPAVEQEEYLSQRIDLDPARHGTMDLRVEWSETVTVLALVVALIMLLACANLAALLVTRGAARAKELGIRSAIGAGRGRLVRLLLAESALLAAGGGAAGLLFAAWLHHLLLGFVTARETHLAVGFQVDSRVLGFTVAASGIAALLFGAVPALRVSGAGVAPVLKGLSTGGKVRRPALGFVTIQVAISLVLLVVAGLFLRTIGNLYALDAGFNRESVLLATLDAKTATGRSREGHAFQLELTERLEAIPGVTAAALSDNVVFGQDSWNKTVWAEGHEYSAGERQMVKFNIVGPGFFRAARIPVLEGREFTIQDRADSLPVAIVNHAMAEKYFPGTSAVGKHFGDSRWKYEIVGVVADAKYTSLRESRQPTVYHALLQSRQARNTYVLIRTAVPPASIAPLIRKVAMDIDEGLVVFNLRTLNEQVDQSLVRERMLSTLTGLFGGLALLLACVGLYGVTAYGVQRRTNEIGIRVALGALPSHVIRLVLRDTARSMVSGSVIGLAVALAAGRLIENRLFGVSAADPVAMAGAVVGLLVAGLIACCRPVRRAVRVDATEALRHE